MQSRGANGAQCVLRAFDHSDGGAGGHGLYFHGASAAHEDAHLNLWPKTKRCAKNDAGIVFYFEVFAEVLRMTSGGIGSEVQACLDGKVTHLVTRNENRWCVSPDLVALKKIFVQPWALEAQHTWLFV